MKIILIVLLVIILPLLSFLLSPQRKMDRRAAKLAKGSPEEREIANAIRDVSNKIDQGKFLYH